ncbi:MAG: hypothetical protein Tsb0014_29940 [Pleurocapsa sp.]
MQQWQPGHRLKSRPYEIQEVLGEGGFGITYKAKHLTLDFFVVLKTPNRKLQKDNDYTKYVKKFYKEGKLLAKLGQNPHPHIVRVSDLFEEDNIPCIVMDFIPGESLYHLVQQKGQLSESEAVKYIRQIGSALTVCHKAGIIHRDVHPNNILIRDDNKKAVLIDFGVSGNITTSSNNSSGNQAFAPWEQIAYWEDANRKNPQIDIYTLAASLYYLVTKEIPTPCMARKYNNHELEPPNLFAPDLSNRLTQAILRGMEIEPENRPSSIQEWLDFFPNYFTPQTINRKKTFIDRKKIIKIARFTGIGMAVFIAILAVNSIWINTVDQYMSDYVFNADIALIGNINIIVHSHLLNALIDLQYLVNSIILVKILNYLLAKKQIKFQEKSDKKQIVKQRHIFEKIKILLVFFQWVSVFLLTIDIFFTLLVFNQDTNSSLGSDLLIFRILIMLILLVAIPLRMHFYMKSKAKKRWNKKYL